MKNKLTRNNKLITILLHLRRRKMECPIKNMSSYQRIKWEMDELNADLVQAKATVARMQGALWAIAKMKGPEVVEAPRTALMALRPDEKE